MNKKDSTYTIKIFGSKQDVQEATVAIEKIIGINGIKRMTGIKPSSDSGQYFRFIEAHSGSSKLFSAVSPVCSSFEGRKKEAPEVRRPSFVSMAFEALRINKNKEE